MRLLVPFLRPYAGRAIGAAVSLAVAAGLVLLLGQGLRRLIDDGFASGNAALLDGAALAMFAVVAALGVATAARFYLMSWLGERVAADLRRAVFDRVLGLPPSYFETMRTGDVLTRMTADTGLLQGLIGSAVAGFAAPYSGSSAQCSTRPTPVSSTVARTSCRNTDGCRGRSPVGPHRCPDASSTRSDRVSAT